MRRQHFGRHLLPNGGHMFARMMAALALFAASLTAQGAAAEQADAAPPLPALTPCASRSHPLLPEKWRGTYLMAPFTKQQLVLGDFVTDSAIPATRLRLYGLKHGALDVLIEGQKTYLISQDGNSSSECLDVGDTGWRPLPRDWLGAKAQCEGSAPVAGLDLEWWKTPSSGAHSADWIWYKADGRPPFRLMMTQPADRLAGLGAYALSYQMGFEALQNTDLAAEASKCETKSHRAPGNGKAGLQKLFEAMERSQFRASDDIARLAPRLSGECPAASLNGWPEHAAMSMVMTPPDFGDSPMPTEVLYDGNAKMMRTRNFWPARSELASDDALLLDGFGYSVARTRAGRLVCNAALPGALRPNWLETGGCSCEASIEGGTAVTPYGPVRIIVCPMTAPRVVWAWFTADGRPMVFMETSAPGDDPAGKLTLVDYHGWQPGHAAASLAFQAPLQCPAPPAQTVSPGPAHAKEPAPRRCGACHTDKAPIR
jgi:hypothetical protein